MLPRRLPAALLLTLATLLAGAPASGSPQWVASWTASPDGAGPPLAPLTIRQIVRPTLGGAAVRIVLSNEHGTGPLVIGTARVAMRAGGADIVPGSDHALTFGGAASVTLPQGARMESDPVKMDVQAMQELAISLWLPAGSPTPTIHGAGLQTAYLVGDADSTAAATFPAGRTDDSRYFVAGVEVLAAGNARAVAVLGDSIVDGIGASEDRHARWPDVLARRLHAAGRPLAVLNAGIAGNRLLRDGTKPFVGLSAAHRFERDVLRQPGVAWVVVAGGINDITAGDMLADPAEKVSAGQIIDGLRALIRRAHGNDVKVCGATLLPLGGVRKPFVHSAAGEAARQTVNAWIRQGGEFDAVADLDAAVRDPADPLRLQAAFDSGDHLHPNDAGYETIGAAVETACGLDVPARLYQQAQQVPDGSCTSATRQSGKSSKQNFPRTSLALPPRCAARSVSGNTFTTILRKISRCRRFSAAVKLHVVERTQWPHPQTELAQRRPVDVPSRTGTDNLPFWPVPNACKGLTHVVVVSNMQ